MQEERGTRTIENRSSRRLAGAVLGASLIVIVDQLAKIAVRRMLPTGDSIPIVGGVLSLSHVENSGVAFGLGDGFSLMLSAVGLLCLAILVALLKERILDSRTGLIGLSLLGGGAAGNLIDRLSKGTVTDYIDVGFWPVFNVADICISCGVILLVLFYVRDFASREEAA